MPVLPLGVKTKGVVMTCYTGVLFFFLSYLPSKWFYLKSPTMTEWEAPLHMSPFNFISNKDFSSP